MSWSVGNSKEADARHHSRGASAPPATATTAPNGKKPVGGAHEQVAQFQSPDASSMNARCPGRPLSNCDFIPGRKPTRNASRRAPRRGSILVYLIRAGSTEGEQELHI